MLYGSLRLIGFAGSILVFIFAVYLIVIYRKELFNPKIIRPLWVRRLEKMVLRTVIKGHEIYAFILAKIIPAKAIVIDTTCPLPKCEYRIRSVILATRKTGYLFEEIVEANFRSTLNHLKADHNVRILTGLTYETGSGKFEIFYKGCGYLDNQVIREMAGQLIKGLGCPPDSFKKAIEILEEFDTK